MILSGGFQARSDSTFRYWANAPLSGNRPPWTTPAILSPIFHWELGTEEPVEITVPEKSQPIMECGGPAMSM